ncbi:curli assembly chaperone CsgC [Kosakonia oryziphila]|uniref:Curli assembly protein CsgC n=1 Tax=Kosakonia oryziphila TaxID=1005667 RepID=A0A1C4EI83_9ENTR|nr:curli assembly chaperone CsgC [Kosakonia oryziphila]SCC43285.1 curli production protein [Kosakonia oryziphila]
MNTLLLLAALTSQITFDTNRVGDMYTITPRVLLAENCVCQVQILATRQGEGGQSRTEQRKTIQIVANQPTPLMRLSMNIEARDSVDIVVTVTDGQSLNLSQHWVSQQKI